MGVDILRLWVASTSNPIGSEDLIPLFHRDIDQVNKEVKFVRQVFWELLR
jgi:hypothetical protein